MNITGQGAWDTGTYTNLFLKLGYDENEITNRLEETWNELFYGDENTRIYYPMGEDKGYLLDTGNLDVRSEGMSYGMMMAVQMDRKEEFDRLWNFSHTFMQHKEGRYKDYFAWHCKPDGTRLSQGPAPDGEEFFAMALFLPPTAGAMALNLMITRHKPARSFVHVYIRAKTAKAIPCGTRKQN